MASSMFKRILSLNLAVLLGLTLTVPAMALGIPLGEEPDKQMQIIPSEDFLSLDPGVVSETFLSGRYADRELDEQLLLLGTTDPYEITVNGSTFLSNETKTGSGASGSWIYYPDRNTLYLQNYVGGSISSQGSLTVYANGTVSVTASDGNDQGEHGISSTGNLRIWVLENAVLSVSGGNGPNGGGNAVYSSGGSISCLSNGEACFSGGNTTESSSKTGGSGILAYYVLMLDGSNITCNGGDGVYYGGYGADAYSVTVNVTDGQFTGGRGSYGGSGILSSYGGATVSNSTVTCNGGNGEKNGGHGLYIYGGTLNLDGDYITCNGGAGKNNNGGHGIYAYSIEGISNSGNVVLKTGYVLANGGNGSTEASSAPELHTGGRGICTTASISIYTDCTLTGGNGYNSAAGITYGKNCTFDLVNVTVRKQGIFTSNSKPIMSYPGASVATLHAHTSSKETDNSIEITINEYTLTFSGNGGTLDGKESFSDTAPYPTYYNLPDYPFTRDGYALMGWSLVADASSSYTSQVVPLNDRRFPKADFTLYAMWASTDGNPVILNGLDGRLAGTLLYESYQEAVTLPEKLDYESNQLLAWNTEIIPKEDPDTHLFSGIWHEGGETVVPTDTPTILYGQSVGTGSYAVYHLGSGTAPQGGTLLVQGTRATGSGLQVLTPDKTQVSAPDGLSLAGWATSENSEVQYECGEKVTLKSGTVTHLYACWEDVAIETETDHGLQISFTPSQKSVCITAPENWGEASGAKLLVAALYASNNQLLQATAQDLSADRTELTLTYDTDTVPILRIFALDQDQHPTGTHVELDLKTLE